MKIIIGLTGTIASGKTTVAEYFQKKGFEHHSYSDILRKLAKKQGINPTRKNLQELGNFLKKKQNQGILSKILLKNLKSNNIIADGIRTVDEIKELKNYENSYVIGIDAPQKIRFERLILRKRKGDPVLFEDFKKIDDHENNGLTKGQNINECLNYSDYLITNDSSTKALTEKIEAIWKKINSQISP